MRSKRLSLFVWFTEEEADKCAALKSELEERGFRVTLSGHKKRHTSPRLIDMILDDFRLDETWTSRNMRECLEKHGYSANSMSAVVSDLKALGHIVSPAYAQYKRVK